MLSRIMAALQIDPDPPVQPGHLLRGERAETAES
jgi:hypothetical protein